MARVYVKGYTKKDGTKVPGHYREMGGVSPGQKSTVKRFNKARGDHGSQFSKTGVGRARYLRIAGKAMVVSRKLLK